VGSAEQDHPGRVVDRGGEPIGRYPPTVRIEGDIDPPAPAVGDRVQEGVVDRREHHDTVAPVGGVPQRHLERMQRTGEGPDPFTIRTPPVLSLLPVCVVLDEVGSERPVAEITTLAVASNGVEHRSRRIEVHVGHPGRHDIGPVPAPLDPDPGPAPRFIHRQQAIGIDHDATVVPLSRLHD
jgi:hypothetical protein